MKVTNFAVERALREPDNNKVGAEELLEIIRRDISEGTRVLRVVSIVERECDDGSKDIETYRCGCSRYEEAALLALAMDAHIKKWRNS